VLSLLILLATSVLTDASAALEETPPLGPEGEAVALNPPSDRMAECASLLRSLGKSATDFHIDRTLVTANPRWGPIYRADFSYASEPMVGGVSFAR